MAINTYYQSPWQNMNTSAQSIMGQQAQQVPQPKPVEQVRRVEEPKTFPYGAVGRVPGSCGIGLVYTHVLYNTRDHSGYDKSLDSHLDNYPGGAGFLLVAYIDSPECKAMFQKLKKKFPILYQSEIRHNTNSGNNFFFCIYNTPVDEEKRKYQRIDGFPDGFKNGLEW